MIYAPNRPRGSSALIYEHDLPIFKAYIEAIGKTEEYRPRMNGHGILEIQYGDKLFFGRQAVKYIMRFEYHECPELASMIELAKEYDVEPRKK